MIVKHFFVKKIAHSSYMLLGKNSAVVIDPSRDVAEYIREAEDYGVKITHILLTHLHADFISGHIELSHRTGAKIYAPEKAECQFVHRSLKENDEFMIEDVRVKVLETPGHTPEHISYVMSDTARGREPFGVFCGDTLFVGDVGRPDLFPGIAEDLAGMLYDSLFDKLLKLPDYCEVYPAHGAGSLCGRAMGAKWRTTIGYEKKYNGALQIKDKNEFIRSLTTGMPPAPDHFSRCSDINRKGPALLRSLLAINSLDPSEFFEKSKSKNVLVLDTRTYNAFGGQHIPGALNIDLGGNFPTFAGWIVPPSKEIILVIDSHETPLEIVRWLNRVGIDKITGYLAGGMFEWAKTGLETDHVPQLSAKELHKMMNGDKNIILIDSRAEGEFSGGNIAGSVNIPAPDLRVRYKELDKKKTFAVICSTGHRSSLAASILKSKGFKLVYNVAGGITGYGNAGYMKQCRACVNIHGSRYHND
ncbi:MAG TPA: rhodanese-like domain-containing protein [Clostridiales bacterium]|nr:rhodanese-like domain-containing protein [Clostridiales bacterium]